METSMETAEKITAARARLADLEGKERERREHLRSITAPYSGDMEATTRELERLEAEAREETARAQLRGLAAGIRAHKSALEIAVMEGDKQLRRTLDLMEKHLEGIRRNREKFFEAAEILCPGITRESRPGDPESQAQHAQARAVLSDLRRSGIDLEAALDSSTGRISPHDSLKSLPNPELGAEIWGIFLEVKQPEKPGELARPLNPRCPGGIKAHEPP
jgi:hypothetical protein